jgi:hypothetical protein
MSLQEEMDKIKVESYKDCVWYLEDEDRCKLPSMNSDTSKCYCKDRDLEEFCIWLTKFFKSTPNGVGDGSWGKILGSLLGGCEGCTILNDEKKDSFISRFVSDVKKKIFK